MLQNAYAHNATFPETLFLSLQLQTKDLELKMAGIKLQEQAELVDRAEVQSKKMSEAFSQMQGHKLETDKLLESYNERFSECQHSIEKSNEVSTHLLWWHAGPFIAVLCFSVHFVLCMLFKLAITRAHTLDELSAAILGVQDVAARW